MDREPEFEAPVLVRCGPWPRLEARAIPPNGEPGPCVGVAVPVHDNADTVVTTVDALLRHLGPNDRIALVENGSRDASLAVLERQYRGHPQIHIDQLAEGDAARARNRAVELLGDVDYVAFCDADDPWLPYRLPRVRSVLAATCPDVLVQPLIARTPTGAEIEGATFRTKALPRHDSLLAELLFAGNFISTSGLILRRSILLSPLFANGLRRTQDYEAWCQLAARHPHAVVCYVDEPAALYRRAASGLSGDRWQRAVNVFRIRRSYARHLAASQRLSLWARRHSTLWAWTLRTRQPPWAAVRVIASRDAPAWFRGAQR
jgi:glycosyltransferase involved in cell wall biosynthesis